LERGEIAESGEKAKTQGKTEEVLGRTKEGRRRYHGSDLRRQFLLMDIDNVIPRDFSKQKSIW